MLLFPNAKINLGLSILNKREDGYHNLESVFIPIPITDSLEFIEFDEMKFDCNIKIDNDKSNSVLMAYNLLKEKFKLPPLSIYLYKNIPIGAGIGGGSADGAFMLKGLNDYFELGLTNQLLKYYANEIGSDCPFFIDNNPSFVEGRGEILSDIELDLSKYYFAIINPNIHVSTKEAFSTIKYSNKDNGSLLSSIKNEPIQNWKNTIFNDFESSVFETYPEIQKIKTDLYKKGALYASMTGTGSTVYGIFENKVELNDFDSSHFKTCVKI
ncbi:4-(cytidine 5'-diphospho)-2-C-methyl-D-erythritol kinase [Flavobacteriales bacterium]|nr:4-(cytidine 5'-diphospho)-2-C-methyl-D-erythritol kinase [Flavobacteriales bacterium]MDB4088741.1 4-(cytidine 5'-diphospho)-2-C-methyl-D-erythritol kinase [Flavobacteriales bacterium]